MKTLKFSEDQWDLWEHARRGKITGSKAGGLSGTRDPKKKLIGFWELVAERLGLPPETDESAMERGSRLEAEAIDRFAEENKNWLADNHVEVDRTKQLWMRDDNESIAISPDATIGETEAVEAKCLSSARHIEAYWTKKIPADYHDQVLQYFVVNDKLQTLHFIFYDPRFAMYGDAQGKQAKIDFFEITVKRSDVQAEVEEAIIRERRELAEINEIVNKLTF